MPQQSDIDTFNLEEELNSLEIPDVDIEYQPQDNDSQCDSGACAI